jgi:hypothetical protein
MLRIKKDSKKIAITVALSSDVNLFYEEMKKHPFVNNSKKGTIETILSMFAAWKIEELSELRNKINIDSIEIEHKKG